MNRPFTGTDEQLDARARHIDLAHQPDFDIGPVTVRPSLRTVAGPDGEAMLEPKVMQVLVALGDPIGTILSRDDLIERCWEGRVVGESSINRVISLLRSGLKSVAGEALCVENVPKVGYRLMHLARQDEQPDEDQPTTAQATESAIVSPETDAPAQRWGIGSLAMISGSVAILLALLAAWALGVGQSKSNVPSEPLSMTMLPLEAGEGVDPLYAIGLETELRGQLAKIPQLEVSANESARLLLEKGLLPEEIGQRLGVDYVWSGEFDVEPERVTLQATLIRVADATVLWRGDVASAVDAAQFLATRHSRAIAQVLGRSSNSQAEPLNVDADDYRLYLTAMGLIRTRGEAEREAALEILDQVAQRNPQFADGIAGLAKAWFLRPVQTIEDKARQRERGAELAQRALAIDPNSVDALKVAGLTAPSGEERLQRLERAVSLDPGDPEAWYWLSMQREENLLASDKSPVDARLRMITIDPLWPPSWSTSDSAYAYGRAEDAQRAEAQILSAAVTSSQTLLSQSRLAKFEGDLSESLRLAKQAAQTQTPSERLFGWIAHEQTRQLLRLPSADDDEHFMKGLPGLTTKLHNGILPTVGEFEEAGAWGASFWDYEFLVSSTLPLFISEGRTEEIVSIYDARFESPEQFVTYVEAAGPPEHTTFGFSPYIVFVLEAAGREREAAIILEAMRAQVDRWKANEIEWLGSMHYELLYAALANEQDRAIEIVRELPRFGWPYTSMPDQIHQITLLLDGHPIYGDIENLPEVRAVLDPIRESIDQERIEARALGV